MNRLLKTIASRWAALFASSVFALIVGLYCAEIKSIAVAVTLVVAWLITSLFVTGAVEYYRLREEDVVDRSRRLELAEERFALTSQRSELTRWGVLLSSASRKLEDIIKELNYNYMKMEPESLNWDPSGEGWVYNQKRSILQSICDALRHDPVLRADATGYFKATLFRVSSQDLLELDCSYYPPGLDATTRSIDRNVKGGATSFRCLETGNLQIIENVPEEVRKGAEARWIELWPGQGERYGSMLTAAVCVGERATDTYKIVSILTIDTQETGYFLERREDEVFWAIFLAPFRALLSFLYLVEEGTTAGL